MRDTLYTLYTFLKYVFYQLISLCLLIFIAFPGILKWQKRLWLTMRDFINHRTNLPSRIPDDEFKSFDDYMFDSRNFYIKGTTFNYCGSQQHSVAISKQQGLTNSLRVSFFVMCNFFSRFIFSLFLF